MTQDALTDFRAAMLAAGLTPPDAIHADGRIHRFLEGDKRGNKNGWYVLHLDRRPAGAFGSWRVGVTQTWCADGQPMSRAERADIQALIAAARRQNEAETRQRHEAAQRTACAWWQNAEPASPEHAYLARKCAQPHGLRQLDGRLLVPLQDRHGLLWNLQRIDPAGGKLFMPGGRVSGMFSAIGDLSAPRLILVCEGWATAATLHEETGHPVLAAMNRGNLRAVAEAARHAWAGADLIIAADNDRFTAGNPGVTDATAAAKATGARLLVPQFADDEPGSDFNDLAALRRQKGASDDRAGC